MNSVDKLQKFDPRLWVTQATKFCTVAPNVFGFSVFDLIQVTLQAPRILRWPLPLG